MMFHRSSFLFLVAASLFAIVTCETASAVPDTKKEWKDIVLGVLDGAFGPTEAIAEECFDDSEKMIADLEQAVDDIRQGTDESVQAGIELIGQVINEAGTDLKECEEATADVEELIEMAASLAHPWSFVYHAGHNIVVNHVEILDEVNGAIEAWESNPPDYYQFGFNVGEILEQILVGQEEMEEEEEEEEKAASEIVEVAMM